MIRTVTTFTLVEKEIKSFESWIEQFRKLDVRPKYPEPKEKDYGGYFCSKLCIIVNGENISSNWNGQSFVPQNIREAVKTFEKQCRAICIERFKKALHINDE